MIVVRYLVFFFLIAISVVILGCPKESQTIETFYTPKEIRKDTPLIPEWDLGDLSLFVSNSRAIAVSETTGQNPWNIVTNSKGYDYQVRQRLEVQGNAYAVVTWIDDNLRPWLAIFQVSNDKTQNKLIYAYPDMVLLEGAPQGDFLFTIALDIKQFNGLELGYVNAISVANGAQKSFPDLCMPIAEATPATPLIYKPSKEQPGDLILLGPQQASAQAAVEVIKQQDANIRLKVGNNNSKLDKDQSDSTEALNPTTAEEDEKYASFLRSILPFDEFIVARVDSVDAALVFKNNIKLPKPVARMSVLTLIDKYLLVTGSLGDESASVVFAIEVDNGKLAWFKEYQMTLASYIIPGDLGYRVPFDYSKGKFLLGWNTDEGNIELTAIALNNGKTLKSRTIEQDPDKPTISTVMSVWGINGTLNASDKLEGKNTNWKKLALGFSNQYWDSRNGVLHNPPLDISIKTAVWGKGRLAELGTGKALKVGRHWVDPFDGSLLRPDTSVKIPEELKNQTMFPGSFFVERKVGDLLIIRRYGVPMQNEFSANEHLFMLYSISNKCVVDSDFREGLSPRYNSEYGLVIENDLLRLLDKNGDEIWKSAYSYSSGYSAALPKK